VNETPLDVAALAAHLAQELVAARAPLALRPPAAAAALSMSVDHFDRFVAPKLRWAEVGRIRVVPVKELEKYLEREARVDLTSGGR
jgi:hypothetical protein